MILTRGRKIEKAQEHAFRFVTPASRRQSSTTHNALAGGDAGATKPFPETETLHNLALQGTNQ